MAPRQPRAVSAVSGAVILVRVAVSRADLPAVSPVPRQESDDRDVVECLRAGLLAADAKGETTNMGNALSRLTLLQINLIGAITALVLAAILFFVVIKPKQDQVKDVAAQAASTEDSGGTQDKVNGKKKDLKTAQADAKKTQADWNVNSVRYMPSLPLSGDVLESYEFKALDPKKQRLGIKEVPVLFGTWVTAWYDAQKKDGIDRQGTEFPIGPIVTTPNDVATLDHLTFPADNKTWPVTVSAKSFNLAMAHLRRFNSMMQHGMPVVDNVTLAGQSPNLQMSYDLALYVIPPVAPGVADPTISATGGASAGAATSGYGGFGGGGYPGAGGSGYPSGPPGGYPGAGGRPGGIPGSPAGGGRLGAGGGKAGRGDE